MVSGEYTDSSVVMGRIVRSISGFDYVYNPLLYRVFQWRMQHSPGVDNG